MNGEKIRKITPSAVVTTFAGSGSAGFNNATGTSAQFNKPQDITIDGNNNIFVADYSNHKIRKITPSGVVTTFAGSSQGYVDATGTSAEFYQPEDLSFDPNKNLYVSERGNDKIRKISPSGVVTTFAGSSQGYNDAKGISDKI